MDSDLVLQSNNARPNLVKTNVLAIEVPVGYKVKLDMFINRTNIE